MKITRLGPTRPLVSLTGLLSGGDAGPAGQVPTSIGSNGAIAWGSNVSLITVNGTTNVLGPYVNFANGSNTTVTVDMVGAVASNTIRIHATGGAASFGSNSNAVGEANAPGASSDSSRADHVHLGVRTISHASNTFAGPITLTTSGLLGITSPTPGTLNFSSIGDGVGSGGGGGGSTTVFDGKPFIWTPPTSAATEDDEFNDGTGFSGPNNGLNAKWSKHNLGTASWLKLSDTIAPGTLLFDIPTGQSQDQSIYQTVPAGDFTLACRFTVGGVGDRQMWAMYIVNSSGTGISICFDLNDSQAHGVRTMTTWAASGTMTTFWSGGQASNFNATFGLGVTMFLRKASGVYHGGFSYSDRARSPDAIFEVNQTPSSFTPAYIGFGRVFGTDKSRVMLELFRKIA